MAYTLLDILTAVKEEGRVDRNNDLDNMIKRIINEVMIKHTRNKEYPELYTASQAVAIASNGQNSFVLPADFAKVSQVKFSTDTGDNFRFLKKQNMNALPFQSGYPSWWYIAGSNLYIYPYSSILTGGTHVLQIGYYKVPAALVADGDTLLIDDLYPIILNETLSRLARYHKDSERDQMYAKDAKEAQVTQQDEA